MNDIAMTIILIVIGAAFVAACITWGPKLQKKAWQYTALRQYEKKVDAHPEDSMYVPALELAPNRWKVVADKSNGLGSPVEIRLVRQRSSDVYREKQIVWATPTSDKEVERALKTAWMECDRRNRALDYNVELMQMAQQKLMDEELKREELKKQAEERAKAAAQKE